MTLPPVVTRQEWLAARRELLTEERALSRHRDAVAARRRLLPMVEIDKGYLFDGPAGAVGLGELFAGRRQLLVYHFTFDPDWDEGCPSCSYLADHIDGCLPHLAARDTALAVVSRAPLAKIAAFRARMGWSFPWVSSFRSDFNDDFHVTIDEATGNVEYNYQDAATLRRTGKIWVERGELPGLSAFLRDGDRIFHTYSTYQRGLDPLLNTYSYLDLTPLGRHEDDEPWSMAWVRHHDRYPTPNGSRLPSN